MKVTDSARCLHKNKIAALFAGILIALGLALQCSEMLFTRLFVHDAWLFTTLFGGIWNIIASSPSAAQWHQNLYYWPLLLVIIGGAILFSRNCKKLSN
ncbi:MAG TPA: hypothetical protein VMB47_12200 [Candidatus Aquilonibacter sp.]|nr:hypothetical protein [Candidatus Aquilonibacter sp.]